MNNNYIAMLLISLIPLILAQIWYHPSAPLRKNYSEQQLPYLNNNKPIRLLIIYILSISVVYGYMNLVIHQMGFYELFFTDIMLGNEQSKEITDNFLAEYGDKHRSFSHGVLHGIINALVIALPFLAFSNFFSNQPIKIMWYHFSYWLFTSMLISGLISKFI